MIRSINAVDKSVVVDPALPIVVAAATSTDVLPDVSTSGEEYAARYIFNAGSNNAFFAFGQECTNAAYHGYLIPGQQLDCSNTPQRVSVYSVGGTTIATTVFRRKDLSTQGNILPA